MKDKSTRFGIIGAGAAGLSLAKILAEQGYHNTVLFEKSHDVGGKSWSVEHGGLTHELGTCYSSLGYGRVHKWMKQAGVRRIRHGDASIDGQSFMEFAVGDQSKWAALLELLRYTYHWQRFNKGAMQASEYSLLTKFWLQQHGFEFMERALYRAMTTMGYGYVDEVPVYHTLSWAHPSLIFSGSIRQIFEPANGWQTLWRQIASQMDVRRNCPVTKITRNNSGCRIETPRGSENFDELILTIPLDEAASIMTLGNDEQRVLDAIEWQALKTTLIETDEWYTDQCIRIYKAQVLSRESGNLGGLAAVRRTLPEKSAGEKEVSGIPAYLCYQLVDGCSDEQLRGVLQSDLQKEGVHNYEIVAERLWKYMPRLRPEALAKGIVEHMIEMQGKQKTWYSGASFSFESIRNIVDFNVALASRLITNAT